MLLIKSCFKLIFMVTLEKLSWDCDFVGVFVETPKCSFC